MQKMVNQIPGLHTPNSRELAAVQTELIPRLRNAMPKKRHFGTISGIILGVLLFASKESSILIYGILLAGICLCVALQIGNAKSIIRASSRIEAIEKGDFMIADVTVCDIRVITNESARLVGDAYILMPDGSLSDKRVYMPYLMAQELLASGHTSCRMMYVALPDSTCELLLP